MSVSTFIGRRYLKAKKKQTFISLITIISIAGVAVGVAALIVVLAVMSGTIEEVKARILQVNSHIIVMKYGQTIEQYTEITNKIEKIPGVVSVEPFIYSQVMVGAKGGLSGGVLRGIDPRLAAGSGLGNSVKTGRLESLAKGADDGMPTVILGKDLAEKIKVKMGDTVRLVTPFGQLTSDGNRVPRARLFKLVGLFDSGMYDYDSLLAYISIEEARSFLDLGPGVTGLEVMVKDIYQADTIRQTIMADLGVKYWAKDWMQMNYNFFSALRLQKVVMFIIISLTVLVAAFNIISTLVMVVMEKTRDIAILKSMGARKGTIMKIFIFQGFFIGILGTLAGLIVGLGLCALLSQYQFIELPPDVYYITTLPVRIDPLEITIVLLSAMTISFLATIYPAWQASRLNPVDVLRYE